jgi:3-oxoacyl-[acyl-carrier-protein] synthase II
MPPLPPRKVVITGIGMITPLGMHPGEVRAKIEAGKHAFTRPSGFDPSPFACPYCAEVKDFHPDKYIAEPKMLRLMNRDAKLAVAAAHLALKDARLRVGTEYPPEDIALFGASGLVGMPMGEITEFVRNSTTADGQFDPIRFGREGLRLINPLLSFKILSNMPLCFVSICEAIQGPNAIYTPWEGQGAQAIAAGMLAIHRGEVPCAIVGGCDVKTYDLAFLSLEQQGLFESWKQHGTGSVPGEGAAFLVIEEESHARARGAHCYARLQKTGCSSLSQGGDRSSAYARALAKVIPHANTDLSVIIAAADGDPMLEQNEDQALDSMCLSAKKVISPKKHVGNLYAAAAALQVGMGAYMAETADKGVLANSFGHGSEQAAFILEKP